MAKFRKKVVELEAFQVPKDRSQRPDYPRWASTAASAGTLLENGDGALIIRTLEGDMRADRGDWVIQGTHGELYPCKPDIFADLYEPL